MRLSFDTDHDKLDGVLSVLSAAYGVSITAERAARGARPRAAATTSAARSRGRKSASARAPRKRAAKRTSNRSANGGVRTADVRAWAITQGIAVADRGRLPADMIAKYEAAQS